MAISIRNITTIIFAGMIKMLHISDYFPGCCTPGSQGPEKPLNINANCFI